MRTKNRPIEVLAPAGSMECLKAAILNGADAVYLGGEMFGARAYAGNFNKEELLEAIDYVHSVSYTHLKRKRKRSFSKRRV